MDAVPCKAAYLAPAFMMIWGYITAHGMMGNLHICEGIIEHAERYLQVLEQHMLPKATFFFRDDFTYFIKTIVRILLC